jgi:hypothetical protein
MGLKVDTGNDACIDAYSLLLALLRFDLRLQLRFVSAPMSQLTLFPSDQVRPQYQAEGRLYRHDTSTYTRLPELFET